MTEISSLGIGGAGVDTLERWALAQFTAPARMQRAQRKERIHEELSQLLFGVDLSPGELRLYRARLLEAIARVDDLERAEFFLPERNLSVPRARMMMPVSGIGWLPSEQTTRTVEVSAAHEVHSRNLAKTLQTALALNPKSVHRDFHCVGIVMARGGEGVRWGEDKVQLSQWGLSVVNAQDYPKVAKLRLPPRFPSQAEMVQFRAG
ncbi:MAG: hypothetical protein WC314_27115 [Vulcanimicrobiota bacterium]